MNQEFIVFKEFLKPKLKRSPTQTAKQLGRVYTASERLEPYDGKLCAMVHIK